MPNTDRDPLTVATGLKDIKEPRSTDLGSLFSFLSLPLLLRRSLGWLALQTTTRPPREEASGFISAKGGSASPAFLFFDPRQVNLCQRSAATAESDNLFEQRTRTSKGASPECGHGGGE